MNENRVFTVAGFLFYRKKKIWRNSDILRVRTTQWQKKRFTFYVTLRRILQGKLFISSTHILLLRKGGSTSKIWKMDYRHGIAWPRSLLGTVFVKSVFSAFWFLRGSRIWWKFFVTKKYTTDRKTAVLYSLFYCFTLRCFSSAYIIFRWSMIYDFLSGRLQAPVWRRTWLHF